MLACTDRRTGQVRCLAGVPTASQQYLRRLFCSARQSCSGWCWWAACACRCCRCLALLTHTHSLALSVLASFIAHWYTIPYGRVLSTECLGLARPLAALCTQVHPIASPAALACVLQVVWESNLGQPLSSLSMRWDGSQVAVGTKTGRVLVHDLRRISTTLAAQQFSEEKPVTALSWQYAPVPKSHKKSSHGSAAAAASVGAASSGSAAPSSRTQAAPGSVPTAAAGLGGRAAAAAAAAAAGITASAAGAGGVSSRGGVKAAAAAATQQPQRTPLIVRGLNSSTPQSGTSSADAVSVGA